MYHGGGLEYLGWVIVVFVDQVQVYKDKTSDHLGELENVSTYWDYLLSDEEDSYFVPAIFSEARITKYKFGHGMYFHI